MTKELDDHRLLSLPLFRGLSCHQLSAVRSMVYAKAIEAGEVVLSQGQRSDRVFVLLRGTLKVCTGGGNGEEFIIDLYGPGEVMGEINAIDGGGCLADVIALESSRLLGMSVADFRHCEEGMPQISRNLLRILAGRVRRSAQRASSLAGLDLAGRIARQLLHFAADNGREPAGALTLTIRPTQSEIAALVGSSRSCVNRVLSQLKAQGHLSVSADGYLVIQNKKALNALCGDLCE